MKNLAQILAIASLFATTQAVALEFKPVEFRFWRYSNASEGDFFSRVNFAGVDTSFRIQAMNEAVADQLEGMHKDGVRWSCQVRSQVISGSSPMINVFEMKDCHTLQN